MCLKLLKTSINVIFAVVVIGWCSYGYFLLLFKTHLTLYVGIASMVFYCASLLVHAILLAYGILALQQAGLTEMYKPGSGFRKNTSTLCSGVLVSVYLMTQFSVSMFGLILSWNMVASGAATCSATSTGYSYCVQVVATFALTLTFLSVKRSVLWLKSLSGASPSGAEGVSSVLHRTTTVTDNWIQLVIHETVQHGVISRTTDTLNEGQVISTMTELLGPDGKPLTDSLRRIPAWILIRTFFFDPQTPVKATKKLLRERLHESQNQRLLFHNRDILLNC